jgi:CubicO group peptidase (beta-lactamase class C family)
MSHWDCTQLRPFLRIGAAGLAAAILAAAPACFAAGPSAAAQSAADRLFAPFNGDVPGASVAIVRNGKVLLKRAYGLADLEAHVKATTRTNYRLASVTKQFTAMAVMILAE